MKKNGWNDWMFNSIEWDAQGKARRWLQKVLHHVWTRLHMAWTLRNADLHRVGAADQEAKRKAK
jgi:hypothetical protein